MAILSFQSGVAYGSVGNAAAAFCLRRASHEVWPVDTVSFSNHPGHGGYRGRIRSADAVAEIVEGLAALDMLGHCRAVLGGYMGSAATLRTVLDAVRRVRSANTDALYCCDPVMGDRDSGAYVPDDLIAAFRDEAVTAADLLAPNHFELELLVGSALPTVGDIVAGARSLLGRGPDTIVVTSVDAEDRAADTIASLVVTDSAAWQVTTPRLALAARGAGDTLSALFLGHWLDGAAADSALARAVSSVFAVVEATAEAQSPELELVAAQRAIVDPPRMFAARSIC